MHVLSRAVWRVPVAIAAALALCVVLLVVGLTPASATNSGAEGKIAFVHYDYDTRLPNGNTPVEIGTVNPDGSALTILVGDASATQPTWSPDGARIAYLQYNDVSQHQLYIMNADGSGQRQVSNLECCGSPNYLSWSADGQSIMFQHGVNIVVLDIASGQHRLVASAPSGQVLHNPQFAPDGSSAVWLQTSSMYANNTWTYTTRLVKANPDGSNQSVLAEVSSVIGSVISTYLVWYPDSQQIGWGYIHYASSRTPDLHHRRISNEGVVVSDIVNNDIRKVMPSPTGNRVIVEAYNVGGSQRLGNYFADLDLQIGAPLTTGLSNLSVWSWQALNVPPLPADATAPAITVATPTEGQQVTLNSNLVASYSCMDEAAGSGLASCVGTAPNGAALDTSAVGDKTFTVTARDNAGNETVKTVNYRVIWPFGNFTGPVDPLPTLNSGKAGGVVPVKFSLGGDRGLNILAAGYPKSSQITCDSTAPVDAIETSTLSPGHNVLTYDSATDQYGYNWKTDKAWKGTCRQLTFMLADGATYKANFKFS